MGRPHIYPCVYTVMDVPNHPYCRIERRGNETQDVWCIVDSGFCLTNDGIWEWEPSSRDEEFIKRTRVGFDEAVKRIDNFCLAHGATTKVS